MGEDVAVKVHYTLKNCPFGIRKSQIVRFINHKTDVTVKSPMKGSLLFKHNLEVKWKGDGDLTCSFHEKNDNKAHFTQMSTSSLGNIRELVRAWIGYEVFHHGEECCKDKDMLAKPSQGTKPLVTSWTTSLLRALYASSTRWPKGPWVSCGRERLVAYEHTSHLSTIITWPQQLCGDLSQTSWDAWIHEDLRNYITLFGSITTLCGTDNIPTFRLNVRNIIDYSMEYCQSHITLLCIWIML